MENNEMIYKEDFKRFHVSKDVYKENQKAWHQYIGKTFDGEIQDWIINEYANGLEILDGNPIYSAKFSNNLAVRIIQSERNPIKPLFASWNTQELDNDNRTVEELVIALQPYKEVYTDSAELIRKYIEGDFKKFQKEKNEYYESKTFEKRIKTIITFFDKTGLEEDKWNITKAKIKGENYDIKRWRKLNSLSENLIIFDIKPKNNFLFKHYKSTVRSLVNVNEIITLKHNFDLYESANKSKYNKRIVNEFSNIHNFVVSYNSKVDALEESLKILKEKSEKLHITSVHRK